MINTIYPKDTSTIVMLDKMFLIKDIEKRMLSERLSTRMIKCASVLPEDEYLGWQMIVPKKGLVKMSIFGTKDIGKSDLEWISEKVAKTKVGRSQGSIKEELNDLYELYLPVADQSALGGEIGFGVSPARHNEDFSKWPSYFSSMFTELLTTLRSTEAVLRVVVGPASEEEQLRCRKNTIRTYDKRNLDVNDYVGRPVKMRILLRLPAAPSVRLRTVIEESVQGIKIKHIGKMDDTLAADMWNNPLQDASVLPDYAARFMLLEPEIYEPVLGVEVCEEETKKIPASHKNTKDKNAIIIGKATDTAGVKRKITIGEVDLKRHYQIVGQTGTGKSTILSTVILSAIEKGYGLTFFDPHGSTIDTVLKSVPAKYADRIRVVRVGDLENPVPMNVWDSDNPDKEERTINDLCDLFGDMFDPEHQGYLGPRWERWFATFAKASIAFLGRKASFDSIATISQSQDNMHKVYEEIRNQYPELAEIIREEYGKDNSSDFHQTLNWYLCKFQRLTSVEQLRTTLGAGANALDFGQTIDTNKVTLIDLASPAIGTHAARVIGTIILMKLWNAIMERKKREKTHLVVIDEASLFQTNPVPRMLAESRKFGVSMVLCHQHTGQLSESIRDALEANSANFSAFRLSPKDAYLAAIRFDDEKMQTTLTRLDAYNAITTISVDSKQTAPFTLETIRPIQQKNGEQISKYIELNSVKTLVNPYRSTSALTKKEIQYLINNPRMRYGYRAEPLAERQAYKEALEKSKHDNFDNHADSNEDIPNTNYLDEYLERFGNLEDAV